MGEEQTGVQRLIDASPLKIYANGFGVFTGSADVTFVLQNNNRPAALVNMSYTTAKTFAAAMATAISNVETKTGQEIMNMEFIDSKVNS